MKKVIMMLGVLAVAGGSYFYFGNRLSNGVVGIPQGGLTLKTYQNDSFGFSFQYPDTYFLEDRGNIGDGHRGHWVIVLTQDTEENRAVREGAGPPRDGPPAITIDIFQNLEGYDALTWVKGSNDSNYKLGDQVFGTARVAGIPAITYRASGLYEMNNTVFVQGDSIYKFSVDWLTSKDKMVKDLGEMLKTVKFAG